MDSHTTRRQVITLSFQQHLTGKDYEIKFPADEPLPFSKVMKALGDRLIGLRSEEEVVAPKPWRWKCNSCGHDFSEVDAATEYVSADSDEGSIACPKCYANNLDDEHSLTRIEP